MNKSTELYYSDWLTTVHVKAILTGFAVNFWGTVVDGWTVLIEQFQLALPFTTTATSSGLQDGVD